MLDLSDRHSPPRLPDTPGPAAAADLTPELPTVGALARHYKGGLYRVTGLCTVEASLEPGVLYQALDPQARQDIWLRPLSDFSGPVRPGAMARFTPLRTVATQAIRHYLPLAVMSDAMLESILRAYDEPWRFFHARAHIHDLFEKALARQLSLSLEQSLALLFHDIVNVPGAPEGQNEKQSVLLMQVFKSQVCAPTVDWALVGRIIEDTATHVSSVEASRVVLDLDISTLGDDPVNFCAADEMVWLENRHLLAQEDARKDFDTRRLRFLLALAERGPLYSPAFSDLEDIARTNLEGLRQAWVQKYGNPRT